MPKVEGWKKGVGPYSGGEGVNLVRQPDKGFPPIKDIYADVTRNSERTSGFAAKLDNPSKE